MALLKNYVGNCPLQAENLVKEAESLHIVGFQKNKCVLVARDRNKNTMSKVTCMGRIIKSKLEDTIGDKICAKNILCTYAWRAYKAYAADKGSEHYRIDTKKTGHTIKGIYHIQNVNSYHGRMKH